ncbi:hypothetical protein [Halobacterium bonnevillei]|uniref:Uncharacterized protein n=1 Tax=Halobacterium bonnevillei TaxID=2692200 RepID=A0A6B0SNH9_9EURY|nr:hypothetical protein [Halobacterium bonnevillei]MXR20400.1 hypothetical protein [Halobacterium bonnevillei]
MPSSKLLAVALAALLILAGCSALPGAGDTDGDQGTTVEPVDHDELVFISHTDGDPFEAAISVERGGEPVFETTLEADGNGTYRNLTTISGDESYTVTVNTTIRGASGNRTEQFTVDEPTGNATAVRAKSLGIYHESFPLPRRSLEHPLGAYSYGMSGGDPTDLDVRVWYRGERIATATESVPGDELTRVVDLEQTGAYLVEVRGSDGDWTSRPLVVLEPDQHIRVELTTDGRIESVHVQRAFGWN